MQNHSGEHIISGIAHSIFGCDNVGFHMGSENITVDFNVKLSDEQIKQLELSANKAVFENKKIHIKYYSPSELSSINFRSKKNFDCDVRIVTIDDYDSCACCAPHVQQTGEIGCIKIIDSINYKGGVRLFVLCGYDALNYYSYLNMNNKMISQSLSVKQSETLQGFYCNEKEILSLKQSIHDITDAFIKNITESTPETNGNIVRFEPFLDKSSMRILVNSLMPLTSGMCAVFKESGNGGYDYVIGSLNVDMTKEINSVNSSLFGSGGGSKTMICGKVTASRTDIENFFAVAKV